jgi:hypothetical protein
MRTENFRFLFAKKTNPNLSTGGQWYSDTSPFSIPWLKTDLCKRSSLSPHRWQRERFYNIDWSAPPLSRMTGPLTSLAELTSARLNPHL